MAYYKRFENEENVFVEQNILDNNELESYESIFDFNGIYKTTVLYFYENSENERYYALGLLENIEGRNLTIVCDDLSEIFKYKTGKTRRKHIFELIRNNEYL